MRIDLSPEEMSSLRTALDRALDVMQSEHVSPRDVQRVRRVREVISTEEARERPSFEVWPSDDDRVL
jgi:3-polyprenyl-4-hydroxybenzoate decarboxylase